jgi:hypothetical protein
MMQNRRVRRISSRSSASTGEPIVVLPPVGAAVACEPPAVGDVVGLGARRSLPPRAALAGSRDDATVSTSSLSATPRA